MSSAMVSAAPAQGRLFFSTANATPADVNPEVRSLPDHQEHTGALGRFLQSTIKNQPSKILAAITSASHLAVRPAPEMLSSGIAAINALTGGWPRGCLTEICGPASSGRTTLLLAALAAATRRGEFCVLVDASDALHPRSAADAGVDLDRLLWVRCGEDAPQKLHPKPSHSKLGCPISLAPFAREVGVQEVRIRKVGEREAGVQDLELSAEAAFDSNRIGVQKNGLKKTGWKETRLKENSFKEASWQPDRRLEQALHATDLLLESGGFGLIVLDLSDLPPQQARRIPLTTWFRFRRAVENTSTVLLAMEQHPIAGSCSSLQIKLGPIHGRNNPQFAADSPFHKPTHAHLLTCLEITAELMRSRLERKPSRSTAAFASNTAWAG